MTIGGDDGGLRAPDLDPGGSGCFAPPSGGDGAAGATARPLRVDRMSDEVEDRVAGAPTARAAVLHTGAAPLLDAKGAAALLNVPATWVLAEARANRIPHVRLGRYVRFDAAELQVWWLSRRRGPWRSRGRAAEATHAGAPGVSRSTRAA